MSELATSNPVETFLTKKEDLFEVLNNGNGIALVEMPDQLNPQGLVTTFAGFVKQRNLLEMREFIGVYAYSDAASLLVDRYSDIDEGTKAFVEDHDRIYKAVTDMVVSVLPPTVTNGKNISALGMLRAVRPSRQKMTKHSDSNHVTAWLGCNQPGLVLFTPEGELEMSEIPENHVLLTRQGNWSHSYPDLCFKDGVEHQIRENTVDDDSFRVSGVSFISVQPIIRPFDELREEYLRKFR